MHHETITIMGTVANVFAHRFTLNTDRGVVLADLTPHGAEVVALKPGEEVHIEGEQKPSEVKVHKIKAGGQVYVIAHKPNTHDVQREGARVDVAALKRSLTAQGYKLLGPSHRKHKHFEFLAEGQGKLLELHVEFDGHVRKVKDTDASSPKWRAEAA